MPRFTLRAMFLSIGVIGCVFAACAYVRSLENSVRNMYAAWWVGDLIVEHLRKNGDKWPTCWGDLQNDYNTLVQESGQPWTFAELRDRIEIDWSVDVERLRRLPPDSTGNAPFRVVRQRDGGNVSFEGREPNRTIHRYLRGLPLEP